MENVTLIQALAECYNFKPRKKIDSVICFKIRHPNTDRTIQFGKGWSKLSHRWQYFVHESGLPSFGSDEKHFVSNLFCGELADAMMIYSAQQGKFTVTRIK